MTNERQQWELTLDARQSSLGQVADFIENVVDELNLEPDAAFAVQLATDEACQNAVEHACKFDSNQKVTLVCESDGADLVVTVRERGEPFDPTQEAKPKLGAALAKRNGGGLGIHFMRKMMDEVRHERHDDGTNSVTMIKRGVVSAADARDPAPTEDTPPEQNCLEHPGCEVA